ncbi:MAG: hypothetical protein NZ550_04335 [Fimbriimonadales bacterium]|nr:hypothetical protein [Fimbriimonadales bacterium]MDW8051302.1 hypothetical protein [Armatimonadota bacterium]
MLEGIAFEQPERAARLWARWRGTGAQAELFDTFAPVLVDALRDAPDPDRLLLNFDRWLESLGATLTYYRLFADSPAALKPALTLFATSQYMADTVLQNPELSELLLDVSLLTRPRTRADLRRDVARLFKACTTYWMKLDRLRAFKQQEVLRITALDVLGKASLPEVARRLSDLADVCVGAVLEACHQELSAQQGVSGEHGLSVIGMGKWGGRELNYSSDIDLILICADQPPLRGARDPLAYLTKLAEMLVKALSEPMRRGIVFRVDLRLRPEGRFGPLVRTLSAAVHYYENWAELWERQAMLKARVCAGDPRVGATFLEQLQGWLYRPAFSEAELAELADQRARLEAQARARNALETDIKNGWGGIRDIEFATQALQLILGGKYPRLRTPNTLEALHRLKTARLLSAAEADALSNAYCFLRTVEHRLQIQYGHQTHTLPSAPAERARFAKLMGYADPSAFEADLQRHREVAHQYRERVLRTPTSEAATGVIQLEAVSQRTLEPLTPLLGTPEGEPQWLHALQELGFREPSRAYSVLVANIVGTPYGIPTPEARRAFEAVLPKMLAACARTPDPDRALTGLEQLADAYPNRASLFAAFAESPEVLTRLAELAQAPPLWNRLLARLELLDMLFGEEIVARGAKSRAQHAEALQQRLSHCRTVNARLTNLAAYARREQLRIGARDLWGETSPEQTARDLTALAEVLLIQLWQTLAPDVPILIIGWGSLGAGDLGYRSDWDIAFACADTADLERVHACAQQFLSHCQQLAEQGAFRPVDTQLRPEGKAGALVRTLLGWASYFANTAEPWERLAALRARPLNPESPLSEPFLHALNAFRYGTPPTPEALQAMHHLIQRALTERVPPTQLQNHLKLGRAGQAVIDFLTHWLVVQHATLQDHPHSLETCAQLEWLWRRGLIERADHDALVEAWQFLYHLRNRLTLLFDHAPETLPTGEALETVARSLNFPNGHALQAAVQEHQANLRAIAERFWHR